MIAAATRNISRLCSAIIILFVAGRIAFGCSMAQLPERPRSIVASSMYILVGEVVDYTEPVTDPGNFRGTAKGVRLKVVESIQFPHFQNDYVELFMFGHGTDCFPEGREKLPPIGTRYRLALFPARLMASMSGSHVRLESRVFDRIASDESMFGFSTTAASEFDYKNNLQSLARNFRQPEMSDKRAWLDDFLYIEASKDLIRFQRAATREERMRLLERLLYCPNINYRRLVFSELGKPFQFEENDPRNLLILSAEASNPIRPKRSEPRKLTKAERRLLEERERLEKSGKLRIWN